jgi:mono/diheme cytochrome c family protein
MPMKFAVVRVAVCSLPLFVGYPALAQEVVHPGQVLYKKYCESCHGSGGKGDGEVAASLKTPPADLTQLAQKNGGTFPFEKTVLIIDGRSPVRAHGTSQMPVWGERFEADIERTGGTGRAEPRVKDRIRLIVEYLRSLQAS